MKKASSVNVAEDMRKEYGFSRGVRGKYATRTRAGSNVVILDPDVAEVLPNSKAVNDALRALTELARAQVRRSPR